MAAKKITQKYWNDLSADSRFRALRMIFSQFPDSSLRDMSKETAKQLSVKWKIVSQLVRIPDDTTHYKTMISNTFIP